MAYSDPDRQRQAKRESAKRCRARKAAQRAEERKAAAEQLAKATAAVEASGEIPGPIEVAASLDEIEECRAIRRLIMRDPAAPRALRLKAATELEESVRRSSTGASSAVPPLDDEIGDPAPARSVN